MMNFDFYLSEMSISSLHGGGLTLQRVIGDGLKQIPWLVHVSRFAGAFPADEQYRGGVLELTSPWDSDKARAIIGRTFADRLSKKLFIVKRDAKRAANILNGKFEPDREISGLICPQGIHSLYTLEALKCRRPVKYVTWIMDDHLVQYVNGAWQYPKGIEAVFAKHLRGAQHVFVISEAMQAFYKDRFDIDSTVLFGPADLTDDAKPTIPLAGALLKIGYFGAVAAWQTDVLIAVANALNGTTTELHIYSGIDSLPEQLQTAGVHFKGRVAPDHVLSTMRAYDAILLPMSFLDSMRNMSAFNVATKMSEYLASGVPVLAIGPPYAAMIGYLKRHNAAIVVETCGPEIINAAIQLCRDEEQVATVLQHARQLAQRETGTVPMRRRWLDL